MGPKPASAFEGRVPLGLKNGMRELTQTYFTLSNDSNDVARLGLLVDVVLYVVRGKRQQNILLCFLCRAVQTYDHPYVRLQRLSQRSGAGTLSLSSRFPRFACGQAA